MPWLTGGAVPGSGLSQEAGSVEQLSLHCAEGSLEWLYPTGALRLRLAPRLPPATAAVKGRSPQHVTACVKPSGTFRGAQLYLEREGMLELLLPEAPRPRVRCFSWAPQEKVALFLQATPHPDISRRIAAFRYELRGDWLARPPLPAASPAAEGQHAGAPLSVPRASPGLPPAPSPASFPGLSSAPNAHRLSPRRSQGCHHCPHQGVPPGLSSAPSVPAPCPQASLTRVLPRFFCSALRGPRLFPRGSPGLSPAPSPGYFPHVVLSTQCPRSAHSGDPRESLGVPPSPSPGRCPALCSAPAIPAPCPQGVPRASTGSLIRGFPRDVQRCEGLGWSPGATSVTVWLGRGVPAVQRQRAPDGHLH